MDVSAPPSLDSACPQENIKLGKHARKFMECGFDNEEHRHEASNTINQQYKL